MTGQSGYLEMENRGARQSTHTVTKTPIITSMFSNHRILVLDDEGGLRDLGRSARWCGGRWDVRC